MHPDRLEISSQVHYKQREVEITSEHICKWQVGEGEPPTNNKICIN